MIAVVFSGTGYNGSKQDVSIHLEESVVSGKIRVKLDGVFYRTDRNGFNGPFYGIVKFNGQTVKTLNGNTGGNTVSASQNAYVKVSSSAGSYIDVPYNTDGPTSITVSVHANSGATAADGRTIFGATYGGHSYDIGGLPKENDDVVLTTYQLTTVVNPAGYGEVTAGEWMPPGVTKTLVATPASTSAEYLYEFHSWEATSGSLSSTTTASTEFTMGSSDATVTANFRRTARQYYASLIAGSDIASVSGGGIKSYGTQVNAQAVVASVPGYYTGFAGWYENGTKVYPYSNYSFAMPARDITLTAVGSRTPKQYTLSLVAGSNISVVSGGGAVYFGTQVTVTAVLGSATGYTYSFDGWYNGSTKVSSSLSYTFTYNTVGDLTLTAKGSRTINSYLLTLTAGDNIVSVSGGGSKVYNSSVTAVAVLGSASGYSIRFDGWYKQVAGGSTRVSTDLSYTFNMPASEVSLTAKATRSLIVYFLKIQAGVGTAITVSRTSSPNAGASIGDLHHGSPIYYGDVLSVSFSSESGYTVATRTINGDDVGETVTYTVTGGVTIAATATLNEYSLSLVVSNSGVVATALRLSSPIGGGESGQLFDGATLYYGDEIQVSYSFGLGYQVDEHMINGVDFDSGDTYVIVGDTTVTVTASASGFVYINNRPYLAYIGDGDEWKRYQAFIGDGSNWVAH